VREPVSVETLRRELLPPAPVLRHPLAGNAGWAMAQAEQVVPTLLADRIAEDARRPACGITPPPGTPASRPADPAPVEGSSRSALLPKVGLILSSPCLTAPCGPVADPASGQERRGGPADFSQQRERRSEAFRRDSCLTPGDRCGEHSPLESAAVAQFPGPSVGQPPCRGDADLPTGSHARIAARKAGYAQRNADERPPAGGEPHRHR